MRTWPCTFFTPGRGAVGATKGRFAKNRHFTTSSLGPPASTTVGVASLIVNVAMSSALNPSGRVSGGAAGSGVAETTIEPIRMGGAAGSDLVLSLIHISEPTRLLSISY